jgi:molybdopterin/thiamine biosynthesis adenylyltransferase
MKPERIVVIGCGGIGGALVPYLARYMQYSLADGLDIPLILVDGDEFEAKNLDRQNCSWSDLADNKAVALKNKIEKEFDGLEIETETVYVNADNVAEIIKEGDLVFLGLDNHKSRKIIADHIKTLENITVISGGNELEDGNVMIFLKVDNRQYTANLDEYNPEIADPKDKSPDELGCADMVVSARQIIFMNLTIATLMLNAYYRLTTDDNYEEMYGEVYTDIRLATTKPYLRSPLAE